MGVPEKLSLRWDSFEANTRTALLELREVAEFLDVTLVAGDGNQVKAHKVILASGSTFFHKILRENPHPHPLIYLKDVAYKHLLSLVDFLYTGQVTIIEEDIDAFLDMAQDLNIKGLTPADKQPESIPKTTTPVQSQVYNEEKCKSSSGHVLSEATHQSQVSFGMEQTIHGLFYDTEDMDIKTEIPNTEETSVIIEKNQMNNYWCEQNEEHHGYHEDGTNYDKHSKGWYEGGQECDDRNNGENHGDHVINPSKKSIICSVCGQSCACNSALKIHMRSHTREKPFHCLICPKKFSRSDDLKKHTRIHTGEKPFPCLVCPKKFSRSDELKRHTRDKHTGGKPYQCSVCPKKFPSSSKLRMHRRLHKDE